MHGLVSDHAHRTNPNRRSRIISASPISPSYPTCCAETTEPSVRFRRPGANNYRAGFGFHSRASFFASATCAGVMTFPVQPDGILPIESLGRQIGCTTCMLGRSPAVRLSQLHTLMREATAHLRSLGQQHGDTISLLRHSPAARSDRFHTSNQPAAARRHFPDQPTNEKAEVRLDSRSYHTLPLRLRTVRQRRLPLQPPT